MSSNPFYKVLPGTVPFGSFYENRIPSLIWLRLLNQENIADCSMSASDDSYGNVDDLVFDVTYKDGEDQKYALQLKYEQKGRNIQPDSVFGTPSGSKENEKEDAKENKKENGGNFNLSKYINSFISNCSNFKETFLILFTNRGFYPGSKPLTLYLKLKNKPVAVSVPIKPVICHDERLGIFNTSTKSDALYKFEVQDLDCLEILTEKEKRNLELFFRYFIFFTSQTDLDGTHQEITNLLKYYLGDLKDDGLYCKYLNFFYDWSMCPKERSKLTFKVIKTKIIEFLFSSFIVPFVNPPKDRDQSDLLINAIADFQVTFVRSDFDKFLEDVCYKFIEKCEVDMRELIKIARMLVILEPKQQIKSISDFSNDQIVQMLRFKGEIPWIIKVTSSNKKTVQRILSKNSSHPQKFILLLDEAQFDDFSHERVFKTLRDLPRSKLDPLIENLTVTVMDKQISLRHLITDKKYPLELIRVHNVIQMMDKTFVFVKNSVKLPDYYVNRVIIKPVVSQLILSKESGSLFVVSNPKNYPSDWSRIPNKFVVNLDQDEEEEDGYNGDKHILITERKMTYEYFNSLKRIVIRYQSVYAFELLPDGNLKCLFAGGSLDFTDDYAKPILIKDCNVFEEFTNDMNLLVADTGMGKSVLTDYLVQNCPSDYWPLKINVREHYSFFVTHSGDGNDILKYFLNEPMEKFTEDIRAMYVKERKVFVVWDGLDEFPVGEIGKVIEKIKKVRLIGSPQWVTSKRHLSETLKREFEVVPASLTKLSVQEQDTYIRERLKGFREQSELDAIIVKLRDIITNIKWKEVLGVPLLLFLLTDIYSNPEVNIGNFLSLDEIYGHFIDRKYDILTAKKNMLDENNALLIQQLKREKIRLQKNYQEAAVLSNFDEDVRKLFVLKSSTQSFIDQIRAEGDDNGLIIKIGDDKRAIFLHNTFGDYFAACYLADVWQTIDMEVRRQVTILLFQDKYRSVKTFFDYLLTKDSCFHKTVLAQDWERVETFPADVLDTLDRGGRTVLHLICMFDRKYAIVQTRKHTNDKPYFSVDVISSVNLKFQRVFSKILESSMDCNSVDFSNMSPLHYADLSASYFALNALISKCPPSIEVVRLKSHHPATILFNACVYDHSNYLKKILDEIPVTFLEMSYASRSLPCDDDGTILPCNRDTPIQTASKNGYNDVVSLLVSNNNINNDSALYKASANGHLPVVRTLLDKGASLSYTLEFLKKTPLHIACQNGHVDVVTELMKRGADTKIVDVNRRIPVHLAMIHGHDEAALALIRTGIDGSICDIFGEVLLNLAAQTGKIVWVEEFLKNGTAIDCRDKYGFTPMHFAARCGLEEIAKFLLSRGADWDVTDYVDGETPLHLASANGHLSVVRLLLERGARVSATDKYGQTALHLASLSRFLDVMVYLISRGADRTALDGSGRTPLHLAAFHKYLDVALVLVGEDARLPAGAFGQTSLHLAALHGYLDFVQALTAKTGNVSPLDGYGQTPLHIAAESGYVDVVAHLLEKGADPSIADHFGQTALHLAAINRHPDVVKALIQSGASRLVYNDYGHTPLGLALLRRLPDVIQALLYTESHEEDYDLQMIHYSVALDGYQQIELWIEEGQISLQTSCGNTALHVAALLNNQRVVQMLLYKGVDVSLKNGNGHTAADLAVTSEHRTILSLLGASTKRKGFYVDAKHPVHIAVVLNEVDLLKLLLHSHSGCEHAKDGNSRTALQLASLHGRLDMAKLLIVRMVDLHHKDCNGDTALHLAAKNGHLEMVKLLLECGCLTGVKNEKGLLALDYAKKGWYKEIVELLMDVMHGCVLDYL